MGLSDCTCPLCAALRNSKSDLMLKILAANKCVIDILCYYFVNLQRFVGFFILSLAAEWRISSGRQCPRACSKNKAQTRGSNPLKSTQLCRLEGCTGLGGRGFGHVYHVHSDLYRAQNKHAICLLDCVKNQIFNTCFSPLIWNRLDTIVLLYQYESAKSYLLQFCCVRGTQRNKTLE